MNLKINDQVIAVGNEHSGKLYAYFYESGKRAGQDVPYGTTGRVLSVENSATCKSGYLIRWRETNSGTEHYCDAGLLEKVTE